MEELHREVEKLTGSQAKDILLNLMYRLKMIKDAQDSKEEMVEELFILYDEIIGKSQSDKALIEDYEAVHLVCGEAAAGTLRYSFGPEAKVIGIPDLFSVGPIWELQSEEGHVLRYEWLKNHLNMEADYYEEEYRQKFQQALEEIHAIPDGKPIIIWTAENAHEQTGMRYILYLLKEKANDIYLINSTNAYKELYDTEDYQYFCLHTGEVAPEQLKEMAKMNSRDPLTVGERIQFEKDWTGLASTKDVLRIWEKGQINSVNEDYFDSIIIKTAQKLHAQQAHPDFMLSARIIGDVLGQMEQVTGDSFLEYRLRILIYNGIFDIKGIPKGLRYYSVKLK